MNTLIAERDIRTDEFRRGRSFVGLSFLGMALGIPAMPIYGIGLFLPKFTADFHWSFAAAAFALAILQGVFVFSGPASGYLLDKIGTYRVALISTPLIGLCFISFALLNGSLIQYYLIWAVIALAGAGTSAVVWSRLVSGAFVVHRGLALGIAFTGTGFFVFVIKPLLQVIINRFGWRTGIVALGLLPLLTLWPALYFILGKGRSNIAQNVTSRAVAPLTGFSIAHAFRDSRYYLIIIVSVLIGVLPAVIPHLENIIRSHGFSDSNAAFMASTLGCSLIAGRLVGGYVVDRFWAPAVMAAFMFLAGAALVGLAHPTHSTIIVLVYVLAFGFAVGSEIHLLGYIVARYVGLRHYGTLFGLVYGPQLLLGGVGASAVGHLYDVHHDYILALWGAAASLAASSVLLLTLGKYPLLDQELSSVPSSV
jgi:MFS family permease